MNNQIILPKLLDQCEKYWSASAAKLYRVSKNTVEREAHGIHVYDHNGKKFIDCACSYGVFIVGHRNPHVQEAVIKQIHNISWTPVGLTNPAREALTKKLIELVPGNWSSVQYMVSGAEAIEQTLRYILKAQPHRKGIVVMKDSYHGKTLAAMNILGQHQHQQTYGSLAEEVIFVPYGDIQALRLAIGAGVRAVYLEPILGGAHLTIPSTDYLTQVDDLCKSTETLLVVDEIQTAFGRCGRWFAFEYGRMTPDIIVLSKGLTGGYTSIACVLYQKLLIEKNHIANNELDIGAHGGHPIACCSALAAIEFLEKENLIEQAATNGKYFSLGLEKLAKKYPQIIADAPAIGLMTGLRLNGAVYEALLSVHLGQRGIHAGNSMNEKAAQPVLRLYPPLQVDITTLDHVLLMLDESLAQISKIPPWIISLLQPIIHHLYKIPNRLLKAIG